MAQDLLFAFLSSFAHRPLFRCERLTFQLSPVAVAFRTFSRSPASDAEKSGQLERHTHRHERHGVAFHISAGERFASIFVTIKMTFKRICMIASANTKRNWHLFRSRLSVSPPQRPRCERASLALFRGECATREPSHTHNCAGCSIRFCLASAQSDSDVTTRRRSFRSCRSFIGERITKKLSRTQTAFSLNAFSISRTAPGPPKTHYNYSLRRETGWPVFHRAMSGR